MLNAKALDNTADEQPSSGAAEAAGIFGNHMVAKRKLKACVCVCMGGGRFVDIYLTYDFVCFFKHNNNNIASAKAKWNVNAFCR